MYLLAKREHVKRALTESEEFSSSPYRALGSGTFMLGLRKYDHQEQRAFASKYLRYEPRIIDALASVAFAAAAVLPSKQRKFDLVDVSEQAALRFAGFLFGFEQADHVLLEKTMRLAYLGANYQIMGRHFLSEPGAVLEATSAMGALLQRKIVAIDRSLPREIGQTETDTFKQIKLEREELRQAMGKSMGSPPPEFEPVLKRIADDTLPGVKGDYSGNELAVIVVGLIAGSIGNIQAGASIAINEFFRRRALFERAREGATKWQLGETDGGPLNDLIWEALRLNPPVPFLPARRRRNCFSTPTLIPEGTNVILAVGGATRDGIDHPDDFKEDRKERDPLIFGGPEGTSAFLHQCVGQHLAMPVIAAHRQGSSHARWPDGNIRSEDREAASFGKALGGQLQEVPAQGVRSQDVLTQFPLIVIMKVKTPVSKHAKALKEIIKYGAPKIEKKLRDAGHVHFAWFLFLENDTKLMMATIYDRDFDSYIEFFALEIGPMFDLVFQHIEDPPSMPVKEFPKEFVDTVRRYNNRTAGGYFFSAVPEGECFDDHRSLPAGGPMITSLRGTGQGGSPADHPLWLQVQSQPAFRSPVTDLLEIPKVRRRACRQRLYYHCVC